MRYLKTFGNHNNYEDFTETEAFVKPNVSYCIQLNEVHYNPLAFSLIVRYNAIGIKATSAVTQLYYYFNKDGSPVLFLGVNMFNKVEIDGVEVSISELDAAGGQTQWSEGEHTVKYILKDPTLIGAEADNQTEIPTKIGAIFFNCSDIISVEIPNSVTSIGDGAFANCSGLTSVIIPNSVTSIGSSAFGGCHGLTSITIPNSVTTIGDNAFRECIGLTSITIPNSVTSIGDGAFSNCGGLTSIICNATTAPTIASKTFRDVKTNGTLTIPSGSSGYDVWMGTGDYYLGKYNWTKVEQ